MPKILGSPLGGNKREITIIDQKIAPNHPNLTTKLPQPDNLDTINRQNRGHRRQYPIDMVDPGIMLLEHNPDLFQFSRVFHNPADPALTPVPFEAGRQLVLLQVVVLGEEGDWEGPFYVGLGGLPVEGLGPGPV
jgi:hypothetical protein